MAGERVSWMTLLGELKNEPPPPLPDPDPPIKYSSSTSKKGDIKKDKSRDKKEKEKQKDKKGKSGKKLDTAVTKPATSVVSAPVKPVSTYSTVGPSSGTNYASASKAAAPLPSGSLSARATPSRPSANTTFAANSPASGPTYASQPPYAPTFKAASSPSASVMAPPASTWQQRLPQGALVTGPAAVPSPSPAVAKIPVGPPTVSPLPNRVVDPSTQERRSSFSRTASTPTFSQNAPPVDAEQVKQHAINVVGAASPAGGTRATTSMSVVIRETEQLELEFAALNRELQSLQSKSPLMDSVNDMHPPAPAVVDRPADDSDDWRTYMNSATESVRAILEPQQDEIALAIAAKLEEERRDKAAFDARMSQPTAAPVHIPEEEQESLLREDDEPAPDHRRSLYQSPPSEVSAVQSNRGTTVYLTAQLNTSVDEGYSGDRSTTLYRPGHDYSYPTSDAPAPVSPRAAAPASPPRDISGSATSQPHSIAPPPLAVPLPASTFSSSSLHTSPLTSPTSAQAHSSASPALDRTPQSEDSGSRGGASGSPSKSSRLANPAYVPSSSTSKIRSAFGADGRPLSGAAQVHGETPNAQDLITNIAKVNVKELAKRTEERERETAARAEQLRQLEENKKKHAEQNRVLDAQLRKKLQEEKTRAELKKQQTTTSMSASATSAADDEKRQQEENIRKRLSDERRQAEAMLQRMLEEEQRATEHIRLLREQEEIARQREEHDRERQAEFARQEEEERQRHLREQQEAEARRLEFERQQEHLRQQQEKQQLQQHQPQQPQPQTSPRSPTAASASSSPQYAALMAGAPNQRIAKFREQWFQLFLDSGVPDTFAKEYALTFAENEIELDQSAELTPEILKELKVKLGHILRIIRFVQRDKAVGGQS